MKDNWTKINIYEIGVSENIIEKINPKIIERFELIPLNIIHNKLLVVHFQEAIYEDNFFRLLFKLPLIYGKVSKEEYEHLFRKIKKNFETSVYGENSYNKELIKLEDSEKSNHIFEETEEEFYNLELNSTFVVRTTNSIIEDAINLGVSDIHFEPEEKIVSIRMRKDGELFINKNLPKKVYQQVLSRIKILGNMDITKHFIPQDGKIVFNYENHKYDIRVSTLPMVYGERISLRILDNYNQNYNLEDLYMDEKAYQQLLKLLDCANGMVLVTGPTGSGKTTTLYSLLKKRINEKVNIITVEDPIEYSIKGISQVQINEDVGLDFNETLRSVLRQDPDILMIGEIRDEKTAEIAIRSAITGHLVFSTLHTNDSEGAIIRLLDMKIPAYLIASSIRGVISQRIVRKLCPFCKVKNEASNEYLRGKGCEKCEGTGYLGRMVIAELLVINEELQRSIIDGNFSEEVKKQYLSRKTVKLLKVGKRAVSEGLTSKEEILKNFNS